MSRIIVTLAVDDVAAIDPLGAKETVAMALEPLGQVRVLRVETALDQQMRMDAPELGPPRTSGPEEASPRRTSGGQAPAPKPTPKPRNWGGEVHFSCCLNCGSFCGGQGQGEHGQLYWGTCRQTGLPVYNLGGWCKAWNNG